MQRRARAYRSPNLPWAYIHVREALKTQTRITVGTHDGEIAFAHGDDAHHPPPSVRLAHENAGVLAIDVATGVRKV